MKEKTKKKWQKDTIPAMLRGDRFVSGVFDVHSIIVPINIIFKKKRGERSIPSGPYLAPNFKTNETFEPLQKAINQKNEVLLQIDLNCKRSHIMENFSDLLTVLKRLVKCPRHYRRDFERLSDVYRLKGHSASEIGKRLYGEEADSRITKKKVKRWVQEVNKLLKDT